MKTVGLLMSAGRRQAFRIKADDLQMRPAYKAKSYVKQDDYEEESFKKQSKDLDLIQQATYCCCRILRKQMILSMYNFIKVKLAGWN